MNIAQKTEELFKKYVNASLDGKENIKNQIFELNKKLSGAAVKKYFRRIPSEEDYQEYVNCGYIGILNAIGPYAKNKPQCNFATYAYYHMFKEFFKNKCDNQRVYIPPYKYKIRKKIIRSLSQDIEFTPYQKKIIKFMSDKDKNLLNVAGRVSKNYNDLIKYTDLKAFENIDKSTSVQKIINKIVKDNPCMKKNLNLLWVKIQNDCTLKDIAKEKKISYQAIGQKIQKIIKLLKNNEELRKLWQE